MKILFLNSAKDWGGNEKWTLMAASALAAQQRVYLAYRKSFLAERFGSNVEKFKLPFLFEFDPVTVIKLLGIIKRNRVDVLIPTKRKDYVLAGIAARLSGKKNVIRLGIVRNLRNSLYNNFVYNKLADGIIVNAGQIKEELLHSRFMDEKKIRIIYNGLDLEKLDKAAAVGNVSKKFNFLISSMGRVTNRKGFDFLLKGFRSFLDISKTDDSGVVIIGEGKKLPSLKKLASQLDLQERVIFSGFVENPYPLLEQSDVFVIASKNEGLSNALLEGMYLRNAVISTGAGGAGNLIEHGKNGYLIDFIDHVQLGKYLIDLYQDRHKRETFAAAAHETVTNQFSLEKMKIELIKFFEEV